MGYYCTVPQCTSLAGKTKNVKFHRFPRDVTMANKWNVILKRGKPYTKYSKVCSLHFTQADYNVTTMGQWKTLSKDAVPSQNLPKLHPDGTVMVIRKSRTVKYKEPLIKECDSINSPISEKVHAWPIRALTPAQVSSTVEDVLRYRIEASITPTTSYDSNTGRPKKQDAYMQTDPIATRDLEENDDPNNSSEASHHSYNSDNVEQYAYVKEQLESKAVFKIAKDFTKPISDDYVSHNNLLSENDEYVHEEKPNYEKIAEYQRSNDEFDKNGENFAKSPDSIQEMYQKDNISEQFAQSGYDEVKSFENNRPHHYIQYQNYVNDAAELLRNQQHNLQILQQQHRGSENQNFFAENLPIKQEIEHMDNSSTYYEAQVKTEPTSNTVCESGMSTDTSAFYEQAPAEPPAANIYYGANDLSRPGPELLIAKQNALAAHTQLWQNMKRPFFYSESPHYNTIFHSTRNEDLARILNQ